ncbi:ribosome modulation factor [Methylobacterium hispanicum]|uniref:ribosome modulation factor n=1 Tax=Methylobacterium hispanicum TaxID=270350 RepID=UPI002F2E42A0
MSAPPDDNLDHYALGFYALGKGVARGDCPYAAGTRAEADWHAGYDAAARGDSEPAPEDRPGAQSPM